MNEQNSSAAFTGRELPFSEGIRLSIRLIEEPSPGQFANATPEAQSIALLSILKLEFQSLAFAVKSLAACSRNLRRSLFDQRSILTMPEWPALRLIGDQSSIESALWLYAKEAREANESAKATRTEKRIAVLNTLRKESRASKGYIEVGFEDSQKIAKVKAKQRKTEAKEAKQRKTKAKEALSGILGGILDGSLELKPALLTILKELVKGENLATCPQPLRNKVVQALNETGNAACESFAAILAVAYAPFIAKGQELELDTLNLTPASRKDLESPNEAPAPKRSLAEIIAAKKAKAQE